MSKKIHKSFSKIKISNKQIQFSLRGCKRSRTPSFSIESNTSKDREKENNSVTLSDIDQFLFENFRSLYHKEYEEEISKRKEAFKTASYQFESPRLFDPPQLENLCGSTRFFVPPRSSTSLIMDDDISPSSVVNDPSAATEETEEIAAADDSSAAPDDFIALLTFSPSPYDDFRQSMQEMVEARLENNGKVDWDFMEKLLFCYLDLNNKKSYSFILRAFVDLIVVLRENSGRIPATLRQL